MATYTVQDTTMTALGDAVRNKVIGTTELPYISDSYQKMDYKDEVPIQMLDSVKKMKVKGFVSNNKTEGTVYYKLAIAPNYYNDSYEAYNDPDRIIIENYGDFEVIIESNALTFHTDKYSSYPSESLNFIYEIWGLDENGNEFKYTPAEMIDVINNLMTIPDEALTITGDCQYRFAYNNWNWFIEEYGDRIITSDITGLDNMFYDSNNLTEIPFDINCSSTAINASGLFYFCTRLKKLPNIYNFTPNQTDNLFGCCQDIVEITDDLVETWNFTSLNSGNKNVSSMYNSCHSLRKISPILLANVWNTSTTGSRSPYWNICYYCYALDEIKGIVVSPNKYTSNAFSNAIKDCYRLKDFTFMTNEDGTPKEIAWKSQTIDFSSRVGYAFDYYYITGFDSGITADKEVKDDTTYALLKDDPDWFTCDVNYSRYNHDSAVNTINSLPDCSSSGGTNTIKFMGAAGAKTDGGAINTLTEEEIAVATSRGWTVSLV